MAREIASAAAGQTGADLAAAERELLKVGLDLCRSNPLRMRWC